MDSPIARFLPHALKQKMHEK